MQETVTPSELDLALVNALQLRPRAAWTELAPLLGVAASTLARRWDRLTGAGLAWVCAAPGREFSRGRATAFVLLRCRPGARSRLADRLSKFPETATVEVTGSGSADLLLDVLAPDLPSLSRFLTGTLDQLPGVTSVSSLFATSLYVEGSRWRLRSLDQSQLTALGNSASTAPESVHTRELDLVDHALLDELVRDGRVGLAELGQRTGTSPATVRRRLRRLTDSGILTFRCDVAAPLAGHPVPVSSSPRSPPATSAPCTAPWPPLPSAAWWRASPGPPTSSPRSGSTTSATSNAAKRPSAPASPHSPSPIASSACTR